MALITICAQTACVKVHVGYIEHDKMEAQHQIDVFHQRLEKGEFDAIISDADDGFRNSANRETMIASMRETKQRWGNVKAVTFRVTNVLDDRSPVEVRAVYNTTFEKGDATELFTFVLRGDQQKLAFFNISPGTKRPTGM